MKQAFYINTEKQIFYGVFPAMNVPNKPKSTGLVYGTNVESTLINACIKGNYDVVNALIDKGVDINQNEEKGFTPLICAALYGHMNIVRLLISFGARVNYHLLCLIKEKIETIEEEQKTDNKDFKSLGNWKNLLDFLIQEGKKQ
jgi:ankyrin repeat protein